MNFSQGGEAGNNGRWLEELVRMEARTRRVPIRSYASQLDNRDLFEAVELVERVPYKNLYGTESCSEFVLQFYERRVRIECKVQETSGSVDEKFPYLVQNASKCMPESEIIFLLHGNGPRPHALSYLRTECALIDTKVVRVMNISEYREWFKRLFIPARAELRA